MRKADGGVAQENQDDEEGEKGDQDDEEDDAGENQNQDDQEDEAGEEDEDDNQDDYERHGNEYDEEHENRSQIYNSISLPDIEGYCGTGGSIELKIQILIEIQVESQNKS